MILQYALITSIVVFSLGVYGVLAKRDVLRILISVAIMLSGITLLLVTVAHTQSSPVIVDMAYSFVLFVWVIEVLEVIIALALFLYLVRNKITDVSGLQEFRW